MALVANDITNDSRVLKEAAVLADAGLRVTLLGVSQDGRPTVDTMDGRAVLARLPGAFRFKEARLDRRRRRRDWRLPLLGAHVPAEVSLRKALLAARGADPHLGSGPGRKLGHQLRQVAFLAARARGLAIRYENRAFKFGWRAWDGVVSRTPWAVSWPAVVPEAYDYEAIFGPVIDRLAPDVVHAHDMHVIGVAVRAAARARTAGRTIKVVYDAHEYVPGIARYGGRTRRFIAAWANHERDYLPAADRVVTVSPAIAGRLEREHALDRTPEVVLNTPDVPEVVPMTDDIRSRTGLPRKVPLLVYSGGITVVRGIDTVIRALRRLPEVHLAVVAVPSPEVPAVDVLRKLAADLGVTERVHFVHPVEPRAVTTFLATADAGVIPMLRAPNHEMALPNKLFEYSLAALPLLVSDMASMREFVTGYGVGEVFAAGDPDDFAARAEVLLERRDVYREQLAVPAFRTDIAWSGQAARLRKLYAELLGHELGEGIPVRSEEVDAVRQAVS